MSKDLGYPNLDDLIKFDNLDFNFGSVIDGLNALVGFLSSYESMGFLDKDLPVVDVSIKDVLAFANKFKATLDGLSSNPAGSIQDLDKKLKDAFGLPATSDLIKLSLFKDPMLLKTDASDDVNLLRLDLKLGAAFSKTFGVKFDLNEFLPDGMNFGTGFLSGAADLGASGTAEIVLSLGVNLKSPTDVYLLDSTEDGTKIGIDGFIEATGDDLNFHAGLGPFGVTIDEGAAKISGGLLSRDATFALNVTRETGGPVSATVVLTRAATLDNISLNDTSIKGLIGDLNSALSSKGLGTLVEAVMAGDKLQLRAKSGSNVTGIQLTAAADDTTVTELGFDPSQTGSGDSHAITAARAPQLKLFTFHIKDQKFTSGPGARVVYGRLSDNAEFTLTATVTGANPAPSSTITINKSDTLNNTVIDDIVQNLKNALKGTALESYVNVVNSGNKIVFTALAGVTALQFTANNPAATQLGFSSSQSAVNEGGSLQITAVRNVVSTARTPIANVMSLDFASDIDAGLNGFFDATLPVFFPTDAIYRGDIVLHGGLAYNLSTGDLAPTWQLVSPTNLADMFSIDPSQYSLLDQIILAVDGIDMFLGGVQNTLDGEVFGMKLPLIGDQLSGGADFIKDFREGFVAKLREELRNAANPDENFIKEKLFELLGTEPSGLGLLKDLGTDGVTLDDIIFEKTATSVEWRMKLGDVISADPNIGFDLGIPGLGIEADGNINFNLQWDLDFGFGISREDGFYIRIDDPHELSVNVNVDIKSPVGADPFELTGKLGFLQLTARDKDIYPVAPDGTVTPDGKTTRLSADFRLNIGNELKPDLWVGPPNGAFAPGDTRLSFSELGDISVTPYLKAEAAAELGLELGLNEGMVGSGFPKLKSDFLLRWNLDSTMDGDPNTDSTHGNGEWVNLKSFNFDRSIQAGLKIVEFQNVSLDLGTFISNVVSPLLSKIQGVTEPIQPIIDIITTPIPVLSDLGPDVTLLDLADSFGYVDKGMIVALADLITLVNKIQVIPGGEEVLIPFGKFTVYDAAQSALFGTDFNLGDPKFNLDSFSNKVLDPTDPYYNLINGIKDVDQVFAELNKETGKNAADIMKELLPPKKPDGTSGVKGGWSFPFLQKPTEIFGLLMGKSPTLIGYDLAPLSFGFDWGQFFPIWGPLGVAINVELKTTIDLAFGFDTYGIKQFIDGGYTNPELVLNGLFVSDHPSNVAWDGKGTDLPEVKLSGGLWAAAEVNLGIARGGVAGGIAAEVNFNLNDPDHDGKVRFEEMAANFENEWKYGNQFMAPLAIFDVSGKMTAQLQAYLKINLFVKKIKKTFKITPPVTLLDFSYQPKRPPVLATEISSGALQLNIGTHAQERINGDKTDGDEIIHVKNGSSGKVLVWGFGIDEGQAQEYTATKIVADGNLGNDTIDLSKLDTGTIEIDLSGGAGNDTITLGDAAGKAVIKGGDGNDTITGGGGDDEIYGAAGTDTIHGGGGNDLIFADDGNVEADFVSVTAIVAETDLLYGDGGDDILFGGGGIDTIEGGAGNDIIIADTGKIVFAAPTVPKMVVNVSRVKDTTSATEGAGDTLKGQEGDDWIYGGLGNDVIDGGAGNDRLFAEGGKDSVHGGDGDDLIFGDNWIGVGDELLPSDNGDDDTIYGGGGNDTIYGSGGKDAIYGDNGDDSESVAGDDVIYGGTGNDVLHGDAGDDAIYGEEGVDLVAGGLGKDTLDGGFGNDFVFGWYLVDSVLNSAGITAYPKVLPTVTLMGSSDDRDDDTLIAAPRGGNFSGQDFLDGQEGSDNYIVSLLPPNPLSEQKKAYDSGSLGADTLTVNGTDYGDIFLLRASYKTAAEGGEAFVGLLSEDALSLQRVNYQNMEGLVVNGLAGDDRFYSDDTRAAATLNGGTGDDSFQIGQLYNSPRGHNANVDITTDVFATLMTTRGYLSNGVSEAMTVNGGTGNDSFVVFHNEAPLSLYGEDGNDTFMIKAFALAGSKEQERPRMDIIGGGGRDYIQYVMNAPVFIDGGDGYDMIIVVGTEFGDDFVVTEKGIYGAGLNVSYVNIEALTVDGAEGDDRFFVLGTGEKFTASIAGGLGSDTFNIMGPAPFVTSNDLLGHSGLITHEAESADAAYDGLKIVGISANIADNDSPAIIVTPSEKEMVVTEGSGSKTYKVVLSRKPTADVNVVVKAPILPPDDEAKGHKTIKFRTINQDGKSVLEDYVVLTFNQNNWNTPQTVEFEAEVDWAEEGTFTGNIDHKVASRDVLDGTITAGSWTDTTLTAAFKSFTQANNGLSGAMIRITGGAGIGQVRTIVTNTASSVTVDNAWNTDAAPDSTSTYEIYQQTDQGETILYSGSVKSASETGLTAAESNFLAPSIGLKDALIKITGGTGSGQVRTIASNTETSVAVDSAWNTAPDETSTYEIYRLTDEGVYSLFIGGVESASGTSLTAKQSAFPFDLTGMVLELVSPDGVKQMRVIESSTANKITLFGTGWQLEPVAGTRTRFTAMMRWRFRPWPSRSLTGIRPVLS